MNRGYGILVGLGAFLLILLLPLDSVMPFAAQVTVAVTVLMFIFWVIQPIPIEATSLIPIVAFPLFGVLSVEDALIPYTDTTIFLFLGGFMIAVAMQRWNLHQRIALKIISVTGSSPSRLILGFMFVSAFLSMWMSNSATAMLMIPIAVAVIITVLPRKNIRNMDSSEKAFSAALIFSVMYAVTFGGIATIVGTPANAFCISILSSYFPDAPPVDFFTWMMFMVPFAFIMIITVWLLLVKVVFRKMPKNLDSTGSVLKQKIQELGPLSRGERNTLIVFILAIFLWIFRDPKSIGSFVIPGINSLYSAGILPFNIDDCMIAVFCVLLLFVLPVSWKDSEFTLNWEWAKKIPWGILLLFGGGMALSAAFESSGFSECIGQAVSGLSIPLLPLLLIVVLIVVCMTQFISNTAVANIMIPIVAVLGAGLMIHPFILMLTVLAASSFAFILPVATPPNAVALSTEYITMKEMVLLGIVITVFSTAVFFALLYTLGFAVFGMDTGVPEWLVSSGLR